MFPEPLHFQTIRIPVPHKAVYARLGFRKGQTRIKAEEQRMVDQYIEDARRDIGLKGAARSLPIRQAGKEQTVLDGGYSFSGRALSHMLAGSTQVLLMGATAGPLIVKAISEAASSQDLTRAVVLDAAASEMTDAALDWIMSYMNQELMRRSLTLTRRRFSAGYGDFSLENQKTLYDLLRMDIIGVAITQSCMLIPEKSVTAIAGIRGSRRAAQ
jgi:hypothetical protein